MVVRDLVRAGRPDTFFRSRRVLPASERRLGMGSAAAGSATHLENPVLKKAGILVGVAAAGVLALTSFAFAGDHHKSEPVVHQTNISDGNVANDCEFGQAGSLVDQSILGGDSALGVAGAVTGNVLPTDNQAQTGNC